MFQVLLLLLLDVSPGVQARLESVQLVIDVNGTLCGDYLLLSGGCDWHSWR